MPTLSQAPVSGSPGPTPRATEPLALLTLRICNARVASHTQDPGGGMGQSFSVLVVCSANVCRSPYTQVLLQDWITVTGRESDITVSSAGVAAFPGDPMCGHAADHAHVDPFVHAARELDPAMLIEADLILAAERSHRGAVARMLPSCRPRLFTLRQAGKLGITLALPLLEGQLPDGAPPMPDGPVERLRWLVHEIDAARGLLAASPEADSDIPDRHGPGPHDDTFSQVAASVANLTASFTACLRLA